MIDHVEIVRGPGSALYGNNAFFSVINVVTKRGRDYNWAEGSVEAGSYDTYRGRFTVGKRFTNEVEFVLSGTWFESEGQTRYYEPFFDDGIPAHNRGVAEELDRELSPSLFGKLSYRDFTLEAGLSSREKAVPTASYGAVYNDPRYETIDRQSFVDLKYERSFENNWEVLARANYSRYSFNGYYTIDYDGNADPATYVDNNDIAHAEWFGLEAQASKTLFDRHIVTVGAEFRDYFREDYRNFDVEPYTQYNNASRTDYSAGAFLNTELQLYRTNLILHTGVRYDAFDHYDSDISPRSALILHPVDPTTIKLIYGEAYRAPNLYEAFEISPVSKANPNLQAETIRTYELLFEQRLNQYFTATADAYLNEIRGLIVQGLDPADGLLVSRNEDNVTARGIEFELSARHPLGIHGRASYGLQETEPTLSNSPHHLVKLSLAVPLWSEKVFAGLEARYKSEVTTVSGQPLGDHWIVNATLFTHDLIKGVEFSASVYNLLDQRYAQPGGSELRQEVVRQDRRSFRAKLTYRF